MGLIKLLILNHNYLENFSPDPINLLNNLSLVRKHNLNIENDTFENMGASLKILNLSFNNLSELHPRALNPLSSLIHLQANSNLGNANFGVFKTG